MSRPPAHKPDAIHLERTRSRRPRAKALEAAAEQLAATARAQAEAEAEQPAAQAQGAKVFTLYGDAPRTTLAQQQLVAGATLSVDFYRRLAEGGDP